MPTSRRSTTARRSPTQPATSSRPSSKRLGRDDWIEAALRALTVGGLAALSVERLAAELGATKGSFYWHFKDRGALIEATLAEWERRDTDQLIERASTIDDPRERLRWLFHVVFSEAAVVGIDTALLADADSPLVSEALARVAARRLRYIEKQFKLMGTEAGSDRAMLTYTAFIGLAQLRRTSPDLTPQGRRSTKYLKNITEWLLG
jgi:AcrR family transcriptional regulator